MRFLESIGCLAPAAIALYGVAGLLLLGQFGGQALNYFGSLGWEQVPGTITTSTIEDASDTTGERYIKRVVYMYEVDGQAYQGTRLDLRGPIYLSSREDTERLLAPYPVGADVMPYVNPNDPTQAVLDRSVPEATWGLVGAGGVLLLLALGLGGRYFAQRQPATAA